MSRSIPSDGGQQRRLAARVGAVALISAGIVVGAVYSLSENRLGKGKGDSHVLLREPPKNEKVPDDPRQGSAAGPVENATETGTLKVEVDGPLLESFPIQLKVTVTSNGATPIIYWRGGPANYPSGDAFLGHCSDAAGHPIYWCDGPDNYPSDDAFSAYMADAAGHRTSVVRLRNGQSAQGPGRNAEIDSTLSFPAACDPLPAGSYMLTVVSSLRDKFGRRLPRAAPINIQVEANPAAVAAAENRLLARSKAGDIFAQNLAETWGFNPAVNEWLNLLLSDDKRIASGAAAKLLTLRRLPPGRERILKKAAQMHSTAESRQLDGKLLSGIAALASRFPASEDALDAIIAVIHSRASSETRTEALLDLGDFDQPRAVEQLVVGFRDASPWMACDPRLARHAWEIWPPPIESK